MDTTKFLAAIEAEYTAGNLSSDMLALSRNVAGKVNDFLSENGIGSSNESLGNFKTFSSFTQDSLASIDASAIHALIEDAQVPEAYKAEAAKSIGLMIARAASTTNDFDAMAAMQSEVTASKEALIGVSDLLPSTIVDRHYAVSEEAFGENSNKTVSDLGAAIAVSLLKWHNALTPRVLSTLTVTEPVVTLTREELICYKLNESTDNDTAFVDLYADPSAVTNKLQRLELLTANDAAGDYLVSDDVLKLGVEADLFALSKDANKLGFDKTNRTDIIADNIKVESVVLDIAGTQKVIEIPEQRARLTRTHNASSTSRTSHIIIDAIVPDNGGLNLGTDKLVARIELTPRVNIVSGVAYSLGSVSLFARSATGGPADPANDATVAALTPVSILGYSLDVRASEENMRKTNIAYTASRSDLQYEIPQGRNHVIDVPILSRTEGATNSVANLQAVLQLGEDWITYDTIAEVLQGVGVAAEIYAVNPTNENRPGNAFAAGGRVRPVFVHDTLDFTGIESYGDQHRQQAIEGRALTFLNDIVAEILTKSFYNQQLDAGSDITFRCITSGAMLANVFGASPGSYQQESDAGVELTVRLSSGVVLEFVTTTFDVASDKLIMIPIVKNDPKSELNFGLNAEYGTLVGSFTNSGNGAAVRRYVANTRRYPIPTNVIGAILDITNVANATYTDYDPNI